MRQLNSSTTRRSASSQRYRHTSSRRRPRNAFQRSASGATWVTLPRRLRRKSFDSWLCGRIVDTNRLALEAEKESEHRTSHTHVGYPDDEIIHFVMTAVIGETDSSLIKRIRATEWKSSDANSKGNRSGCSDATEVALQLPHGLASRRPRRSDLPTGIDQAPRDWSADVRTLEKFSSSNNPRSH